MKLELGLGNFIHIFPDDKGKLLVVPDNVTMQDTVVETRFCKVTLTFGKQNLQISTRPLIGHRHIYNLQ